MLNVVSVMGRFTRDPEIRTTQTGKSVASFTLACDRRKDANGNSQADWLDCVAWDKTAEFICRYFKKGDLCAVSGRLQTRQYQDKNGTNRKSTEIVVLDVSFAGGKSTSPDAENAAQRPAAALARTQTQNDDFALIDDSEDMPF